MVQYIVFTIPKSGMFKNFESTVIILLILCTDELFHERLKKFFIFINRTVMARRNLWYPMADNFCKIWFLQLFALIISMIFRRFR